MRKGEQILHGMTVQVETGCGKMYITINYNEQGKLAEIFATLGKSGTCVRHWTEHAGRLISLLIKSDTDIKKLIKSLKGIQCQNVDEFKKSCSDAFALALEKFLESKQGEAVKEPIIEEGLPNAQT